MKIGYPGISSKFFGISELRMPDRDSSEVRVWPKIHFVSEVSSKESSVEKSYQLIDLMIKDLEQLKKQIK